MTSWRLTFWYPTALKAFRLRQNQDIQNTPNKPCTTASCFSILPFYIHRESLSLSLSLSLSFSLFLSLSLSPSTPTRHSTYHSVAVLSENIRHCSAEKRLTRSSFQTRQWRRTASDMGLECWVPSGDSGTAFVPSQTRPPRDWSPPPCHRSPPNVCSTPGPCAGTASPWTDLQRSSKEQQTKKVAGEIKWFLGQNRHSQINTKLYWK